MRLPFVIHEEGGKPRGFDLLLLQLFVVLVPATVIITSCAPALLLRIRDVGVLGVDVPGAREEGGSAVVGG